MPEIVQKLAGLVDRASNRLIWHFTSRRRSFATSVPIVSFTFDDVPDSCLSHGAPILEKYGGRGTFYIAGSLAGTVEKDRTLITPQGCRELARRGHEIGCHTYAHKALRTLPGKALARDLDRNAAFLHEAAGIEQPHNFAFPYNAAWPLARRELRRRFRTCRAGGEAVNRGAIDPMMLKGVGIRQPDEDAQRLTAIIDDVADNPGWLIFYGHDVTERPTQWGCTPQTLELLVGHAAGRGCALLPVAAALDRLGL